MNYYERHIGDYLKDTAHLSLLEHGVYTRLMDVYYTREGGIPAADAARLVGARSKDERDALAAVLREFFNLRDGMHMQDRCDREIQRFHGKQAKAKASADARWNALRSQSERNANASDEHEEQAMRTQCEGNAPRARPQSPDTKHQTPREENGGIPPEPPARRRARDAGPSDPLPGWVDATAWDGYEAMRKAARKPMTPAARRLAVAELAKLRDAGHDPTEVLRQSTFRSWVGLFPVKAESTAQPGVNGRAPIGAMSEHGLQTMRNAKALEARLFGAKTPEKVEEVGDGA